MQPITQSSKSIVYGYTGGQKYAADSQTTPDKAIMDQSYFRYGLNFVNLFKLLVDKKGDKISSTQDNSRIEEDGSLREIYNNKFFMTYLKIPQENINSFITFVQKNGLNDDLLKEENEMEFIQYLIDRSREFREKKL